MLTIGDKEIGLFYCLGAAKEVGRLSGGLDRISEYFTGDSGEVADRIAHMIAILNKWYVKAAACNGVKAEAVDMDWLDLNMNPQDIGVYADAVIAAINAGTKKEITVKPVPQKNVKSGGKRSS